MTPKVPAGEHELVRDELVWLTDRVRKQGLSIPEAKQYIHRVLSFDV